MGKNSVGTCCTIRYKDQFFVVLHVQHSFDNFGLLYTKAMNDQDRKNLVSNIVGAMSGISGPTRDLIINRQLCHFFRANVELGMGVANGLGVKSDEKMTQMV